MKKAKRPTWEGKTTTAHRVAAKIATTLREECDFGERELQWVADAMADLFDFTPEEYDAFVAFAVEEKEED
jgi:hypothetical protein